MSKALEIIKEALAKKIKISTAESCTGGMISDSFVSIPCSSIVFFGGMIVNGHHAKTLLLDIKADEIAGEKVYSKKTALKMAKSALNQSECDITVATTGVAGPTGGGEIHPIGSVYIAIAVKNGKSKAHHYLFTGDRNEIRKQATEKALELVLSTIKKM